MYAYCTAEKMLVCCLTIVIFWYGCNAITMCNTSCLWGGGLYLAKDLTKAAKSLNVPKTLPPDAIDIERLLKWTHGEWNDAPRYSSMLGW